MTASIRVWICTLKVDSNYIIEQIFWILASSIQIQCSKSRLDTKALYLIRHSHVELYDETLKESSTLILNQPRECLLLLIRYQVKLLTNKHIINGLKLWLRIWKSKWLFSMEEGWEKMKIIMIFLNENM